MALLTRARLDLIGHGKAEHALDLDATMETVSPTPLWEMHPLGLRLVDRDAVREFYRLMFEHIIPHIVNFPNHNTHRVRAYGEDCYIQESVLHFNIDGRESESYHAVVITCDDRYVTSERSYLSGPVNKLREQVYGHEFRKLPGVLDIFS